MHFFIIKRTMKINQAVPHLLVLLLISSVISQEQFSISDSLNAFTIQFLATTSNVAEKSLNLALSPYTVWTLLTLVSEGSLENTARQLDIALRLPSDKFPFRRQFRNLSDILQTKTDGATLELTRQFFTTKNFPVKDQFKLLAKKYYTTDITTVNFKNSKEAADVINKFVSQMTKNRIRYFVSQDDVRNAQVFLTSTLYFKGRWKYPFNSSATHKETFFDSTALEKIGEVNMMYQTGVFPYTRDQKIRAQIIELPYGFDGKMSMIVILPFKGETVDNVLRYMTRVPFIHIIQDLENAELMYIDDEVHVYLPRFSVSSDFNLNIVFQKMGIKDVFDSQKANLLGMFPEYLYLSRIIQKAEIEVNEEGTVASAASGAAFPNKMAPPEFRANRPFLYFIIEKKTKTIVFAGKLSNPNDL